MSSYINNVSNIKPEKIKSNSLNVSDSKNQSFSGQSDTSSYKKYSYRMKEKMRRYGNEEDNINEFNSRHTAYLFSIWIIFIATFMTGFIVHFETDSDITASSIIWTFSGVLLIFALIYSYLYYKCSQAKTGEEMYKYARFIPC